jgi:predicted NBD/HSP70 family sugar kinase
VARAEYGSLGSLRDHNRRRVVEELQRRGTASRADLARITGLSRSTVSSLVGELQDSGLVVETAATAGDGDGRAQAQGRPPVLLTLDRTAGAVVGIDFGHVDVHVAVADLARTILAERRRDMDVDHAGTAALDAAAELVFEVLQDADIPADRVLAAGMGVSGPIDLEQDLVHRSAILPTWGDIRPGKEMNRRLDGIPVFIENDANLGAMAEVAMGAAQGVDDAVYLMLAAGIGAGIVVDGRIIHGAAGTAGELGHVMLDDNGPICRCGNRGCLETFAAGPAIVDLLKPAYGDDLTLDGVLKRVEEGDPRALRAVADAGRAVGRALAGLVNVLNPEVIVIGGQIAAAGDALLEPICAALARYAIPSAVDDVRVVQSPLGGRAEILGALILAAHRADVPHFARQQAVP